MLPNLFARIGASLALTFMASACMTSAPALPQIEAWLATGAPARLRFDAALAVDAPFPARGRVAHQVIEAGEFATTTHVGPFDSLPDAYLRIFERVVSLKGYVFVGLPAVEFYRSVRVNTRLRLSETQICLPVRRIGR